MTFLNRPRHPANDEPNWAESESRFQRWRLTS